MNYRLWEVQQQLANGEWENTWTMEEDIDGETVRYPAVFPTRGDAEQALDEHLKDMEAADMDHDRDEFRIVQLELTHARKS